MNLGHFDPFMISNPTLPKMYWEVKSPEQLIANLYCMLIPLRDHVNDIADQVNINSDEIKNLYDIFESYINSGYSDFYKEQIKEWITNNLPYLWTTFCEMAFVGLTSDGHFCVYIPDAWNDITFDTGAVYGTPSYGRLILRYNVDGDGVIDNTSPYYEE